MDEVQKSKVRLAHWIDHNLDHLTGYAEVAQALQTAGLHAAALSIRQGMRLIESANTEFQKALSYVSDECEKVSSGEHTETNRQNHVHEHSHVHSHEHVHMNFPTNTIE